jgi:chromosome segregation ATPase
MKKIISAGRLSIIVLVLALAALPGCGKKEQTEKKETVSGEDVKKETKEAIETASDFTLEQMQVFRDQMDSKLVEYGEKIDLLQAKAEKLEGDARANADQQLEALRQKYSDVSDKLDELKNSGTNAWDQLKSGISSAMNDLGNAYKNAADELGNS